VSLLIPFVVGLLIQVIQRKLYFKFPSLALSLHLAQWHIAFVIFILPLQHSLNALKTTIISGIEFNIKLKMLTFQQGYIHKEKENYFK